MRVKRRTHVRASPAVVWRVLADPERWPEYDLFVHRVSGPRALFQPGERRVMVTRPVRLPVALDVLEVLPEQMLRYRVQVAPGLSDEVVWELAPALRGGTLLTLTESLSGLFVRPAFVPLCTAAVLRLHRLAGRAAADMRDAGRDMRPGAA